MKHRNVIVVLRLYPLMWLQIHQNYAPASCRRHPPRLPSFCDGRFIFQISPFIPLAPHLQTFFFFRVVASRTLATARWCHRSICQYIADDPHHHGMRRFEISMQFGAHYMAMRVAALCSPWACLMLVRCSALFLLGVTTFFVCDCSPFLQRLFVFDLNRESTPEWGVHNPKFRYQC